MTLEPLQRGRLLGARECISHAALTAALTDAPRHPLKTDMEAGGIELTLDHRKPFAGPAVTRYGSDFVEFDSRPVPFRSAALR